jgi:hypothetical protein
MFRTTKLSPAGSSCGFGSLSERCGSVEAVAKAEDAAHRVVQRLDVRDAAVGLDHKIADVAARASDRTMRAPAALRSVCAASRRVVQRVDSM